jgi:predicted SprT family Zn-dependent metalloprotease
MARLAGDIDNDSDGGFPDLKSIVRSVKGKKPVVAARRHNHSQIEDDEKQVRGEWKDARKAACGNINEGEIKGKNGSKVGERSVKKKRVLGKRDDNPLLRPITKSANEERVRTDSSEIYDVGAYSISKAKAKKARKIALGRRVKQASTEADEPTEELGLKEEEHRPLEMSAHDSSQPSSGLSRAKRSKVKEAKEEEKKTSIEEAKSRPAQAKVDSENNFGEEDGSETPHELNALGMETSRLQSAELSDDSKISKFGVTKSRDKKTTKDRVKVESAPVTINLVDYSSDELEESVHLPDFKASNPKKKRQPPPRTKSKFILTDTEEEDSPEDEDSDGMSDFIVSDNESLEEEDSVFEVPPPETRSARKLFRGRKPNLNETEDEDLDLRMRKLKVDDNDDIIGDVIAEGRRKKGQEENGSPTNAPSKTSRKEELQDATSMKHPPKKNSDALPPSSDTEDLFTLHLYASPFCSLRQRLTIFSSPSENKPRKVSKETRFTTPPGSPKLKSRTLPSPVKLPRIPTSPHRQSSDAFWSQEVVNNWNDEYSPRKSPKPTFKPLSSLDNGTLLFSPRKSPAKEDRLTKHAKKAFSQIKHQLAESFLKELDEKITDGKIAEMAADTGGVKIIWSKKLNTTAGRANWKRETIHSKMPDITTFRHYAAIELAEKVIDDEDRLLNVIAHEFCHLANFMVSNIRTNPHGKEFKAWATRVSREFGNRGIEVTTKHSYEIEYKYIWECENCGTLFKRHSKSIDPGKHKCGVCKSKLVQTKPVPRVGDRKGREMTGYQAFVKENMRLVREENPGSPQKEIMGLVGKRYQEFKATKLKEIESGSGEGVSKEGTPVGVDDDVETVSRKLDFLDLTSP